EIEEQIEQSKNKYIDLLNEEATVKNELKHIEQQLTQQEATAERMSDRSVEMVKRLESIRQQKQELLTKHQSVEQQLSKTTQEIEILQIQLNKTSSSFEEKQKMLYQAYQHQQQ